MNINEQANFIWSIADLLRGDFKQSEYGKVILPFTVLRRFDCVLAPSKARILEANKTLTVSNKRPIFKRTTGHDYYNISQFDFEKLMDDSNAIEANLRDYINGFSEDVREIMDNFEIFGVIDKLSRANLLYLVVQRFAEIDMSDTQIDNLEMGYMFEELIRRFSEQSNETAGEHFTPREVIELMVEVLLDPDMDEIATTDGKVITILDPACGTGGMLSVAQNKMQALNATTRVIPFGQELNPETYATCCSDMILKGNTNSRIVLGNSFNEDGFQGQTFDYMLSNPPFGVEWKKVEKFIKDEAKNKGYSGRFGAGLPRISDGSFLFLQHLISKMNAPENGGSRIGIVFNGSPMFSGDAGSGESEIRRWIIENDLLEAIKAMVVTGSRLHAVRYYQEFQRYIKKMGYENELGILIAFSGTVRDGGEEYTEVSLNGIKESELPEKFHGGEYQVLLVAEKYQTGFDEPLLHTMFVDKKLSGVKAVQTLSRLNRTCFGKEDTFVLDFVNSAEDIRAAFAPYYEETTIEETTDANIVYELKSKLDEFRVYWASEIESFAKVFFKPGKKQGNMDFGILNSFLDPAVDRYKGLDENEQEEFKSTLTKFVRAYTFLTNIIRLDDADLHKFHAYAKFLQNKLPKREGGGQVFLDDEVALQYYRVQKIFEGSIALEQSDPLPNKIHPGKPKLEEEKAPLSELIDKINEKFGTEFTNIDKVLEQIVSDMDANEELRIQARNNSQEHFRFPFNDAFMDVVIGRMAQNQQFCERVLDDAKFGDTVRDLLIGVVYDRLRRPTDAQL